MKQIFKETKHSIFLKNRLTAKSARPTMFSRYTFRNTPFRFSFGDIYERARPSASFQDYRHGLRSAGDDAVGGFRRNARRQWRDRDVRHHGLGLHGRDGHL